MERQETSDAVQTLQKWVQGSLQALADFSANEAKRLDKVEKEVVSSRGSASAAERKLSEIEAEGARMCTLKRRFSKDRAAHMKICVLSAETERVANTNSLDRQRERERERVA